MRHFSYKDMSGMCLYIDVLKEELVWVTNKWLLVISSVISNNKSVIPESN